MVPKKGEALKTVTRVLARTAMRGLHFGLSHAGATLITAVANEATRAIREHVANTLTSRMSIEFNEDAVAYSVLSQWVLQHCPSAQANVIVCEQDPDTGLSEFGKLQIGLGEYYFTIKMDGRRYCICARVAEVDHHGQMQYRISILVFGDAKRKVISYLRKTTEEAHVGMQKIYMTGDFGHLRVGFTAQRTFDSVVLKPETEALLRKHLRWFKDSRSFFAKHGLAYKTTILLYGPPGTGKTSLCRAMAHELGYSIVIIKLSKLHSLDTTVLPRNSLVLIEDIDKGIQTDDNNDSEDDSEHTDTSKGSDAWLARAVAQREAKKTVDEMEGMRLLMQMLDGIQSPNNAVFVMTTNHPELLPPEFDRPGRVNLRLNIGLLDTPEALRLGNMYDVPEDVVLKLDDETRTYPSRLHEFVLDYAYTHGTHQVTTDAKEGNEDV
jgi:hypothetical protein